MPALSLKLLNKMRVQVVLECSVCKNRNYRIEKNKVKHPERLEVIKFCSHCNKRVVHKESK